MAEDDRIQENVMKNISLHMLYRGIYSSIPLEVWNNNNHITHHNKLDGEQASDNISYNRVPSPNESMAGLAHVLLFHIQGPLNNSRWPRIGQMIIATIQPADNFLSRTVTSSGIPTPTYTHTYDAYTCIIATKVNLCSTPNYCTFLLQHQGVLSSYNPYCPCLPIIY